MSRRPRRVPQEVIDRYYPHLGALPTPDAWANAQRQVEGETAPEHDGSGPPVCEPCSADCPACAAEQSGGESR